jgi:hypothetical protein
VSIQFLFIAVVGGFVCVVAPYAGWATAFLSGYLLTLGGVNTALYVVDGVTKTHVGMASGTPTIWLGDVLLTCALLAIWVHGGRLKINWLLAAFTLLAFVLLCTVWGNTSEQWSGLKVYVTAIVAFAVGRWLSENLTEEAAFILACVSAGVCALQLFLTVAQSQGVMLLRPGTEDTAVGWINHGRMVGLYGHPANLGKIMFLLFCFLLPLTSCRRDLTRRLAYAALAFGSMATLLTVSRANTVAIGMAIVLWVILGFRTSSIVPRLGVIAFIVGVVAMSGSLVEALQQRQLQDPDGGFRGPLFSIGLAQIQSAPLTGTGPNYYNEVVGRYDKFAAAGYPVHNSFLYPVAELGILLAALLFAPLIVTLSQTTIRVARQRRFDPQSAALFGIVPGLVVIGWTGWGLIAPDTLPLWFMGFGFLAGHSDIFAIARQRPHEDRPQFQRSQLNT